MTEFRDLEIVTVRPRAGAQEELLALRPTLVLQYHALFGDRVSAVLSRENDERWVDVWLWADRADAERVLAQKDLVPAFERWEQLVELESVVWSEVIG